MTWSSWPSHLHEAPGQGQLYGLKCGQTACKAFLSTDPLIQVRAVTLYSHETVNFYRAMLHRLTVTYKRNYSRALLTLFKEPRYCKRVSGLG